MEYTNWDEGAISLDLGRRLLELKIGEECKIGVVWRRIG